MGQANVNTPDSSGNRGGGAALAGMGVGMLIGLLIIAVLLVLAYLFLWPLLSGGSANINVTVRP